MPKNYKLRASGSWLINAGLAGAFSVLLISSAEAQSAKALPQNKLAPPLLATPEGSSLHTYRVQTSDPVAFRRWAQQHLPEARLQVAPTDGHLFTITGRRQLSKLAACPWVAFIDAADRRAQPEKELDGLDLGANRVWPVHQRYPNLTGQGLTVSIKEEAFDSQDLDFQGRVLASPLFGATASDHATTMATLIGGGGNSSPVGKGVAWQARLATSNYAQLLPDDGQQLASAGVTVQNHSYGVATIENYYGIEARAYDQQGRQYPALLHVFSAGNQGTRTSTTGPYANLAGVANLTGQFKTSKNTLSVGATDALGRVAAPSSRGPAYDGRIKPELVALGETGTSDAAAVVSGAALLVQQAYRDQHGGALPTAALVKAALLNSADDVGRPGPDFEAGFGQADALGAVQTILDNRFRLDAAAAGATRSFPLTVPAGARQLKITLAWADPEAAANAAQALVNDLDVELVGPGGQRWRPWVLSAHPHLDSLRLPARRGVDRLNNVEQLTLVAPAAGTYQVQVRGQQITSASTQAFALAYEFETEGLTWSSPVPGAALRTDQPQRLRWQWGGATTTGRLEYRLAGGNWRTISANVDMAAGIFNWTPPDTTAAAELRLVVGAAGYSSGDVALSRPTFMTVGYACDDETLLAWSPVPGAERYQVLRLGSTQLEPLAIATDTTWLLSGATLPARHYAVLPLLPGSRPAVRSRTIDYTRAGTACYVRSFQPRQLVDEQVTFELEIGSTFGLRTLHLERESNGDFETVHTLTPIATQLRYPLTDVPAEPGLFRYRVRLETTAGRSYYSAVESAYFVRAGEVLVLPNFVNSGESVKLVGVPDQPLSWQLYDSTGRLLRQDQTDNSSLSELNTSGMRAGTYVLRLRLPSGRTVVRRLVVL